METQSQSTDLVRIVKESGLEQTKADYILQKFTNFFEIAADWERKSRAIVVTDISQVAEMKMAREGRLFLKQKRVEVENTRKELKEQSLREGKAIDGISNVLKSLIIPTEEYLEQQEKFAEIQEANRRSILKQTRVEELLQYEWQDTGLFDLGTLPDSLYDSLLMQAKKAYNDRIADAQRIEEERIAKEKAEREERERIKAENERLQREAEAREKAIQEERARLEAERKKMEEKARKEREEAEKKLAEERRVQAEKLAEEQAKARKEAEAREKAEKELQAKKEAEIRAQKEAEAERKAKEIADKKAAAAPDKEKLLSFIAALAMPDLSLKTAYGQATEKVIREKFEGFKEWAIRTIKFGENSLSL